MVSRFAGLLAVLVRWIAAVVPAVLTAAARTVFSIPLEPVRFIDSSTRVQR